MIRDVFSGSPWLLLAVQATLCMAAGLAASCLLRRSAARAHQVLLTALLASVLTPGVYLAVRHFQFGMLPPQPVPVSWETMEPALSFDTLMADLPAAEIEYEPAPVVMEHEEAAAMSLPWSTICLACWVSLSGILLGRLALRFALGLRLLTTARPVKSERLHRAVESARVRLRAAGPIRIRCSERIKSPIIWCWTRQPVLLVHARAAGHQDDAGWVGVFCHELAHLKRRDHLSGLFVEAMAALLPWHPLVWWAKARLAKLSEQACDDWVLAAGHSGVEYAETLLGLAAQRQMAFVPTVIGKERTMNTRIRRIIKDRCGDPRIGTRWTAGVSILAMLAVVSVGFAQRRPAEQEEREVEIVVESRPAEQQERPDPAAAGRRNVLTRLLDQLRDQARQTEARLRERGDEPGEEGRVLRSELDTLRGQIEIMERQLGDLERQGPRRPAPREERIARTRSPQLDERLHSIGREREDIAQARHRTEQELAGLRDDQDAEASELRGRLRELQERDRRLDATMRDLERARSQVERRVEGERPMAEREEPMARTRAQLQSIEQQQIRRDQLAGRMQELKMRAGEIAHQLESFENRESDRARNLEKELDRTHDALTETLQELRNLERRGEPSDPEPRPSTRRGAGMYGEVVQEDPTRAPTAQRPGESDVAYRTRLAQIRAAQARQSAARGQTETRVYALQNVNPEQIRGIIDALIEEPETVTVFASGRKLAVNATVRNHLRIEGVIRELDVPAGDRDLKNEVGELRNQMNGLREQLQQMQRLLEQVAERGQKSETEGPVRDRQEFKIER